MTGSDDTYSVSWTYETFVQDMTPQQAAELAASVFHDGDPIAGPGRVEVTVRRVVGGVEENLGEFIVEHGVTAPTPPKCPTDGDVGYPGGEPGLWLCSTCGAEMRT